MRFCYGDLLIYTPFLCYNGITMEVGVMCGRYTLTLDDRLLRELFGISPEAAGDFEYSPNYNICPVPRCL